MALLFTSLHQFTDNNTGAPVASGTITVYDTGTTTRKSIYTNAALTVAASNPLTLDSAGRLSSNIYVTDGERCTVLLETSSGATVETPDDIWGVVEEFTVAGTYTPGVTGGVARTVQSKLDEDKSLVDCGAVGDGVTVNTTVIQSALDSGALNLYIPPGTYLTGALTLSTDNVRLFGEGTLKAAVDTGALDLLTVTGDGCQLDGFTIDLNNTDNTYAAGFVADRNGVVVQGTSNAAYGSGFRSDNLKIKNCGEAGMIIKYMDDVQINRPKITRCGQYGVFALSVSDVTIDKPRIKDIYPGSTGTAPYLNAYGITFTNESSNNACVDCQVFDGFVEDVTSWEAYDTHYGKRIRFINCSSLNCHQGIAIASNGDVGYESEDIHITGGSHKSYGAAYARDGQTYEPSAGVVANMGNSTNNGEGLVISGVLTNGHGSGRDSSEGAIQVQYCDGFTIIGCTLLNNLKRGIALINECLGMNIIGNLINGVTSVGSISVGIDMSTPTNDSGNVRDNVITGATTYSVGDTEVTIASGVITATMGSHTVDTESDASTDDLDTINGGYDGRVLYLNPESSARTIVVKDGTGNMELAGDFSMDNAHDQIALRYDDAIDKWIEVSRSNNGA
jgi:hypothetical protein